MNTTDVHPTHEIVENGPNDFRCSQCGYMLTNSLIRNPCKDDPVNHPKHYTSHPSGVECIQVTEHMGFNLGNAVKYIWRADLKGQSLEDLAKAAWYINREIEKRKKVKP